MSDKFVSLPSGLLVPRSLGTQVEKGFGVKRFPDDSHVLERLSDGKVYKLAEPTKEAKEWLAERDHEKRRAMQERSGFDGVRVPLSGTWQALAGTDSPDPIGQFSASWSVPSSIPTTLNGQTLFYWIGLTPSFGGAPLLQPVLQFGPSGAGTPSGYGIASWYVASGGGYFVSSLVAASVTSSLYGSVASTGSGSWDVNFLLNGSYTANLPVSGLSGIDFKHADMVLENIVSACNENLSFGVTITNSFISKMSGGYASVSWSTQAGSSCSYYATNNSLSNPGGSVTLGK